MHLVPEEQANWFAAHPTKKIQIYQLKTEPATVFGNKHSFNKTVEIVRVARTFAWLAKADSICISFFTSFTLSLQFVRFCLSTV